jgi:hypothetical protein
MGQGMQIARCCNRISGRCTKGGRDGQRSRSARMENYIKCLRVSTIGSIGRSNCENKVSTKFRGGIFSYRSTLLFIHDTMTY